MRSSHIHPPTAPEPKPEPPWLDLGLLELGLYAGQVIADSQQWMFGGQIGVRVSDQWWVRPHGSWTPSSTVTPALPETSSALTLTYQGYDVGLDVCRSLVSWAAVCALTELQRFTVSPGPIGQPPWPPSSWWVWARRFKRRSTRRSRCSYNPRCCLPLGPPG